MLQKSTGSLLSNSDPVPVVRLLQTDTTEHVAVFKTTFNELFLPSTFISFCSLCFHTEVKVVIQLMKTKVGRVTPPVVLVLVLVLVPSQRRSLSMWFIFKRLSQPLVAGLILMKTNMHSHFYSWLFINIMC